MSDAERLKGPVFKITETDPVSGAPESGILDTSSVSGRRRRLIKEKDCPDCKANFTRTVFTNEGRRDTPPYSCVTMKFAQPNPTVYFGLPKKGEAPDVNLKLFLSNAACKPVPEVSGISDTPSARGYDAF